TQNDAIPALECIAPSPSRPSTPGQIKITDPTPEVSVLRGEAHDGFVAALVHGLRVVQEVKRPVEDRAAGLFDVEFVESPAQTPVS
ncbi:MAG: hypothetical protein M3460_10270, partial [Actinomycetota bacterium]|nr:hypothetical protein [Actinomycetota bacterium]